ncbi:hypothetical protein Hanom_Chr00s000002g01600201 [Helianthus anomalus]
MASGSNSKKEVIRLEREAVIPILKPKLVMNLANLIDKAYQTYKINVDDNGARWLKHTS